MAIERKSITFRLTLLFASLSTAVLLSLGLLIGALVERHFEELDMNMLVGELELLRHPLEKVHSDAELEALPEQLDDMLAGHRGLAVIVLKPDGQVLYSTEGVQFPPELRTGAGENSLHPMLWTDSGQRRYRGISTSTPTGIAGAAPAVVAVSTDLTQHEHFMQSFKTTLWTVVGLAALLSGFLGWMVARRGLAPLRAINCSVADITANHLDQRLPAVLFPAELAEVAQALNAMLARLEESFRRLSEFSADLAHELRTPVSNLLTQTQVTLSKTRTIKEYQNVLGSNVEEFERLSRMIADMLFLAKADNDLIIPHCEKVDLAAEVSSLFEFYEALLEEKSVSLTFSGGGTVFGDRLMLRRAIGNLLSNAIRHTPNNGRITVHAEAGGTSGIVLTVANTGETIAPEHLPRLFDRFYRMDASRQHSGEGAGLGLAITRSIAHAHGGEVRVRSESGVTTFGIRLPA
ncbi:MAG: heavy metal sensor histidine kinase [Rhodocyclales bacterium]|nr:heavy metal sensor histidine kinase [Rhodocyclales bacterium]